MFIFKRNRRTAPLARQARAWRFALVLILLAMFIMSVVGS
jgi:hypothetical protein